MRNTHTEGPADVEFTFGADGDIPIAGHWGVEDGVDTVAVYRPPTGKSFFRYENSAGPADETWESGILTGYPIAGAFGLERSNPRGQLRGRGARTNNPNHTSRVVLTWGTRRPIWDARRPGWRNAAFCSQCGESIRDDAAFCTAWSFATSVLGDPDSVGVMDSASAFWLLLRADGTTAELTLGDPGDTPLLGDWDCDGIETPGAYRPSTGQVFLRNTVEDGPIDVDYEINRLDFVPLAGDFDGDDCDTVSYHVPAEGLVQRPGVRVRDRR